jgi:predicted dehydrogenase
MKQWNIGVVGAGSIARVHAQVAGQLPNAVFAGCCDGGSGRAKSLCAELGGQVWPDYQAMVDDSSVDVVLIATPSGRHMEPAVAAAKAGKHVLCEKPLEITLDRIDRMIAAHDKAGTYLGGIFQNRFTDGVRHLRRAIAEGRFGLISYAGVYVPWWRPQSYYDGTWRGTWALDGGGALMNQSIHMVDMLCDLIGPVVEVKAMADTLGHTIEAEDTAAAVVRFENDALGLIYGTTASYPGRARRFEITGTRGTAIYSDDRLTVWDFADPRPDDKQVLQAGQPASKTGGAADPKDISTEYHRRNLAAFLEAIEHNKPFELDGREARKAVELVLRIYADAHIGKP